MKVSPQGFKKSSVNDLSQNTCRTNAPVIGLKAEPGDKVSFDTFLYDPDTDAGFHSPITGLSFNASWLIPVGIALLLQRQPTRSKHTNDEDPRLDMFSPQAPLIV